MKKQLIISAAVVGAVLAYAAPAYASTATQLAVSPAAGASAGFTDVTAVSGTDGWAVGGDGNGIVQRFNGTRFTTVAIPNLQDGSANAWAGLASVDATSSSSAYAVGSTSGTNTGGSAAVALRWNGSSWTRLAVPRPAGTSTAFTGVNAFSATDVWAVGEDSTSFRRTTVAMHFDGSGWTRPATPSPGTRNNDVTAVDGSAPDDVWAVGYSLNLPYGNRVRQSMVLHWNGSAWTQVASPNSGSTYLYDVASVSRTDAWAVGSGSTGGAFVLRWNGSAWNTVAAPPLSSLSGVAARSGTDVWVSGSDANGVPNVAHWTGSAWALTPVTVVGGVGSPWLTAVTTADATTELAVGRRSDDSVGQASPIAFRVAG